MVDIYKCQKCEKEFTYSDYSKSNFCTSCGAFLLLPNDKSKISPNKSDRTVEKYEKHRFAPESNHRLIASFYDPNRIRKLVDSKHYSSLQDFLLNLKALEIKNSGSIDRLISIDALRTKLTAFNFQMEVALKVLNDMSGTAILGDEVGLGKTIEAGLIMKELLLREEVESVLIVTPNSVLSQWKQEMAEKFGEGFVIANKKKECVDLAVDERIICSHNFLLRKYEEFCDRTWDLIIVDEAHAFRNTKSKGRAAIANIRHNHMLLLTATPLCNKLTDLFSIVDLIQPGILESERAFISKYAEDTKCRILKSEMADDLKATLHSLMCRTRRDQTGMPFPKRFVDSRSLPANKIESEFIDRATDYLRDIGNNRYKTVEELKMENPTARSLSESQSRAILIFQAINMQQSISSSPDAAIESLRKRQERHPEEFEATSRLIDLASKIQPTKLALLKQVLLQVQKEHENEQALIFCSRKITTAKVKEMLSKEFGKAETYSGDLTQNERDSVISSFKNGGIQYLVATDAAAEGLNLQNCALMFNYDLHWNPMKIEQRIGRVHRLKQERDVTIFNLTIKDTIDDYVLHILYQKIELFTMTVGKMETVLAEMKEGSQDLEKVIMEIIFRTKTKRDIKAELERLATDIHNAKKQQQLYEQFTKGVLD